MSLLALAPVGAKTVGDKLASPPEATYTTHMSLDETEWCIMTHGAPVVPYRNALHPNETLMVSTLVYFKDNDAGKTIVWRLARAGDMTTLNVHEGRTVAAKFVAECFETGG